MRWYLLHVLLPTGSVCRLIDWLRPGAGHKLTDRSDPPCCMFCGLPRRKT